MAKQYRGPVMASIHETAEGLHAAGVMDKQTMRKFDDACLTPVRPLAPEEIRSLREREGASQAVFAREVPPLSSCRSWPGTAWALSRSLGQIREADHDAAGESEAAPL